MLYTFFRVTATSNVFDSIRLERAKVFSDALEARERKEQI